jgi:hypothetical protein
MVSCFGVIFLVFVLFWGDVHPGRHAVNSTNDVPLLTLQRGS